MNLPSRNSPISTWIRPIKITARNSYSTPSRTTRLTMTTATEPVAPEIMPGLPPTRLVTSQIANANPMPTSGLMWASSAKATTSGTRASAVVRPASISSLALALALCWVK